MMDLTRPLSKEDQSSLLGGFWVLLGEAESKAHCNDDRLLKVWVEQYYGMWNRLTGDNAVPRWLRDASAVGQPTDLRVLEGLEQGARRGRIEPAAGWIGGADPHQQAVDDSSPAVQR